MERGQWVNPVAGKFDRYASASRLVRNVVGAAAIRPSTRHRAW